MRRSARSRLIVGLVAATAAVGLLISCGDSSNEIDDERVATISSYPLLETAPVGAERRTGVEVRRSENGIATESSGAAHRAGIAWRAEGPIAEIARFYGTALDDQGWQDITAKCVIVDDERTSVVLTASRWEDDFEVTAGVDLLSTATGPVNVTVAIRAPFHDEIGARPAGTAPDLACLESLATRAS